MTTGIPIHVAITGASGLIGSALRRRLLADGHRVTALVRGREPAPDQAAWDPDARRIDRAALEGVDAVVHLAGEGIADHRWSEERKRRILDSRLRGTSLIAETLAKLDHPPRVLASASAIGIYGNRGDEVLDESSPPGRDFLAELCVAWERAAEPAAVAGIRVVHPRFGLVLSRAGGALAAQLPLFRAGLGGPLGDGRQWQSCISIEDAVGALAHLLGAERIRGPVNIVGPETVRNAEFARLLGHALHRPAVVSVPAFALRLRFGELADAALLASQRVEPLVLVRSGYRFEHATVPAAIEAALALP